MAAPTTARTLLSRSFAAAREAVVLRNPVPRPPVRPAAPRGVAPARAGPRLSLVTPTTRWFCSSSRATSSSSSDSSSSPALGAPEKEATGEGSTKQPIGKIEPRLSLTFTCQAGPEREMPVCGHRSSHEFAKKSYEKGVVIIQCPECKARHLIADHLGWFNEVTGDGQHRTVEDLVKARGENVTKGRVNFDGDIEYAPE